VDARTIRRAQRALLRWHARHGMRAPWRDSGDPYQALVAAFMAQQTQMSRVMESYERFLAAFPTLDALADASRAQVIRTWAGMGYNRRAVRLHEAARAIARAGWPRTAADLENIDGVGAFTAAIVASFAFGEPAACVDTNVRRVLGRIAGDGPSGARAMQRLADAWLARDEPARWNQALMDYGARVCLPRPRCDDCVVADDCASRTRFAEPAMLADARPSWDARPSGRPRRPEPPFEGSTRYYRGRIVDLLRALPEGGSLPLARLPALVANGAAPLTPERARELALALQRDGLAVVRRGRIALPEE
jgi:A/G-specific adenine glycosylase